MRPFIIGILGRAGSGKSTAAAYYYEHHGAMICSFASTIKRFLEHLLPSLDPGQLYGTLEEKAEHDERLGMSGRDLMIRCGHGGRELIYPRIWIEALFHHIEDDLSTIIVIDDVRYPNEAEEIVKREGVVIKLDRRITDIATEESVDRVPEAFIWKHVDCQGTPDDLWVMLDALPRPWAGR